jgi:predicted lysophospholipase L1 biosynthesis ABC-type transport system permease subunit
MTQSSADKIATVVVGVVAAGAAYYVLRTPQLRRAAWRLGVAALTGTIPAWVSQEIKASWEASGRRSDVTNV